MQMHTQRMLETHPRRIGGNAAVLGAAVSACYDCAQACTTCADACLNEQNVTELARCIRLDIDCADVCELTGRVLSRVSNTEHRPFTSLVQACADVCRACAEECEKHQHHEHCRICAEACRGCESACKDLAGGMVH